MAERPAQEKDADGFRARAPTESDAGAAAAALRRALKLDDGADVKDAAAAYRAANAGAVERRSNLLG